jgi:uncharacterized membrane protein
MHARAKLFGHSIHQMLIVFPLGLFAASFIFDIAYLVTNNSDFGVVSFWMILAGVIGGLTAAAFGLYDWLAIPRGTRAKAIGMQHGIGNVFVTVLFMLSWMMRWSIGVPSASAMFISGLGIVIAVFTGWMGYELVDRLGVGVDDGAHANAPSSLSGRRADEAPALHRTR